MGGTQSPIQEEAAVIIYVLLAAFLGGLAVGGGGVYQWKAGQEARHAQEQAEADATIQAQAQKIEQDAATKQTEIASAYKNGEANAKVIEKKVYIRSGQLSSSTPAFTNPVCFIGADGLQLANSTRAGIEPATSTAGVNGTVSGAGAGSTGPTGRGVVVSGGVSSVAQGQPAISSVPSATVGTNGGAGVPAKGSGGVHPKPVPVK